MKRSINTIPKLQKVAFSAFSVHSKKAIYNTEINCVNFDV